MADELVRLSDEGLKLGSTLGSTRTTLDDFVKGLDDIGRNRQFAADLTRNISGLQTS
jgi:hypothetical protein